MQMRSSRKPERESRTQKKLSPQVFLAQEEEIRQLSATFQSHPPHGREVAQLEVLLRTAVFKSANELMGWLLQEAADRIDASYQPKPGEMRKGRETIELAGIFGNFDLSRDYYY